MPTRLQRFFLGTVDDDQDFPGVTENVKKLLESAPGSNSATTVTWTTTTITEKTVIPLTANSAAGDTSSNNGWAFNDGGADGLGSVSGALRIIPAGVWNFSLQETINTPALLDTHALDVTAKVYRVNDINAGAGGAITLLFTAVRSGTNTTSATLTWSSASQPDILLQPGQVIMVGITMTSASTTALVLGANTNTVVTTVLGANTWFEVPAPGVRTVYQESNPAVGSGSGVESIFTRKDIQTATGEGVGVQDYLAEFFRAFNAIGEGDADRDLLTVMKFVESVGRGVGTRSLNISKDTIQAIGEGDSMRYLLTRKDIQTAIGEGAGTYDYLAEFFRAFNSIGEGAGTRSNLVRKDIQTAIGEGAGIISRSLQLFRALNAIGKGDSFRSMLVRKDVIAALGEGDGDLAKAAIFVREFNAIGEGFATEEETVIFVREFLGIGKAVIRPRIALDWDDLPDAGGGSTIINVYRPMFVFDD